MLAQLWVVGGGAGGVTAALAFLPGGCILDLTKAGPALCPVREVFTD